MSSDKDEEPEYGLGDETEQWLKAFTNETHLPVEGWDAWTDVVSGERLYFVCFMTPGGRATAVLSELGYNSFMEDLQNLRNGS